MSQSKYGFKTSKSPVPDHLVMDISKREWQLKSFEMTHHVYLRYKLRRVKEIVDAQVANGLLPMDTDDSLRLMYRIRAINKVESELELLTSKGD